MPAKDFYHDTVRTALIKGRLYLAVNRNIFETLFQEEAGQLLLEEPDFRLIVFDANSEEIIQWNPQINP